MITVDAIAHNGILNLSYLPDDGLPIIRRKYMGYTEQEARSLFAVYLKSQGVEA